MNMNQSRKIFLEILCFILLIFLVSACLILIAEKLNNSIDYKSDIKDSALLPFQVIFHGNITGNFTIFVDSGFSSLRVNYTHKIDNKLIYSLPRGKTGENVTVYIADKIYSLIVPKPRYSYDGYFMNCQAYWIIDIYKDGAIIW